MMSFATPKLIDIVKKQFLFKWKGYRPFFTNLVILQAIAIIFSLGGIGSSSHGREGVNVSESIYSADFVLAFTMLWAFIVAILLTSKAYREADFVFITNRFTAQLANVAFLFTISVIGAITAILSRNLLWMITYFSSDNITFVKEAALHPSEYVMGGIATILYVFLFSAVGYLLGSIVQMNKMFAFILPVVFIALLILFGMQEQYLLLWLHEFYYQEDSFIWWFVKTGFTATAFFIASFYLLNRQEVSK